MPHREPKKKQNENIKLVEPISPEAKAAFIKEYDEAVLPLFEKHKLCIVPMVANMSTQFKVHYEAVFAIDVYKSPEPKTNEPANSND